jgi:hypothetical protein
MTEENIEDSVKDKKRKNLSNEAELKAAGLLKALKDFFKPYNLGIAEDLAVISAGYIANKALEMKCHLSNENLLKLLEGKKTDFVSHQAETVDNKPYMKQSMLQLENHSSLSLPEFIYKLAFEDDKVNIPLLPKLTERINASIEPNSTLNFYKWDEKKEVKPSNIFSEILTEQQIKELKEFHHLVEPLSMQLGKETSPSPYKVFVNEKSGEISAVKFNPLVDRLANVLMNYPQIGQIIEATDTLEEKAFKEQANKDIIIELMAGKTITYMKEDKEVSMFFDPIKNRIEAPFTTVYRQQHFNAFVTEQKIMSEDMMINKHQALQFTINNDGIKSELFFEPLNKTSPTSVNELYNIIQQSSKGKGLGIDKIAIQDANQSPLQVELRVVGKALLSAKMHRDRFVVDFNDTQNLTVERKSLHEAKENIQKTEREIELDLHLGSPTDLIKTLSINISSPELSVEKAQEITKKIEPSTAVKVEKAPKQPKISMK